MLLMPQIFDVLPNENACYKRNYLELLCFTSTFFSLMKFSKAVCLKIER